MKVRVFTGIALALVFVPIFFVGGYILDATLLILTGAATFELRRMFNLKSELSKYVMVIEIVLAMTLYFFISYGLQGRFDAQGTLLIAVLLMVISIVIIGSLLSVFDENYNSTQFGNTLLAVLYPSIGFAAIGVLRADSIYTIGFLFAVTIFTDIFAYVVGINFGKTRLAIKISPKKSVEGSIGGTFFAIVFTMLFILISGVETIGNIEMSIVVGIILILVLSAMGQIGDLVASKFKRDYGIKDYSDIFPGHGGVMDRFDSAIFAAMVLVLISEVVGLL